MYIEKYREIQAIFNVLDDMEDTDGGAEATTTNDSASLAL